MMQKQKKVLSKRFCKRKIIGLIMIEKSQKRLFKQKIKSEFDVP